MFCWGDAAFGRREVEVSRALNRNDIVTRTRGQTHGTRPRIYRYWRASDHRLAASPNSKWVSFFVPPTAARKIMVITASDVLSWPKAECVADLGRCVPRQKLSGVGSFTCRSNGNYSVSNIFSYLPADGMLMKGGDCVIARSAIRGQIQGSSGGRYRALGVWSQRIGEGPWLLGPEERWQPLECAVVWAVPGYKIQNVMIQHPLNIWGKDPCCLQMVRHTNGVYCINTVMWVLFPISLTNADRWGPSADGCHGSSLPTVPPNRPMARLLMGQEGLLCGSCTWTCRHSPHPASIGIVYTVASTKVHLDVRSMLYCASIHPQIDNCLIARSLSWKGLVKPTVDAKINFKRVATILRPKQIPPMVFDHLAVWGPAGARARPCCPKVRTRSKFEQLVVKPA